MAEIECTVFWEYLVCDFDRKNFVVLTEQPEVAGEYNIQELGKRGWELVNVSGWQLDSAIAIFKRPNFKINSEGCGSGCDCTYQR